ncbi:hypothetical protein LSCM1_04739 [Leishmania martiniquensis]|uniref:Uncharacterized protein n=1 Tax=Leishmania martiniquensis TaxID=1580590 RepID=A0A836H8E5_9TRYP|nr:hypothetical protein LSCM1_04739 [Leishmania martiniquensis]
MVSLVSGARPVSSPLRRGPSSGPSTISLRMTTLALVVLVVTVLHSFGAPPGVQASATRAHFRCLRPFSATGTFASVAKARPSQNCDLFYFTVEDAAAELKCASPSPATAVAAAAVAGETSCNVTVRWSMRRAPDAAARLQRQVGADKDYLMRGASTTSTTSTPAPAPSSNPSAAYLVTEDADVWRYAVSLKAKGDSTINYKGFHSGDGYSLCCDALEEADCVWMTPQRGDNDLACDEDIGDGPVPQHSRMLRSCPLPFPAPSGVGAAFGASSGARVALTDLEDEERSGLFHGVVTKPLHRIVEGPWEVMVQMWRRRQRIPRDGAGPSSSILTDAAIEAEVLGRLVIPFTLNMAELQKNGRITQAPSMALTVEDVVEVAGGEATGESEDL